MDIGTSCDKMVSCAIYLEDTDKVNGSLRVVPGSHLWNDGQVVSHAPGTGQWAVGEWATVDGILSLSLSLYVCVCDVFILIYLIIFLNLSLI